MHLSMSSPRALWVVRSVVVALLAVAVFLGGVDTSVLDAEEELKFDRLEMKVGKPRTVTIYPGAGKDAKERGFKRGGRVYWYLPYTLKNLSDKRSEYFVSLSAHSDKNKTYSDLALPHVEKKVERIEQKKLQSRADLHAEGRKPGDVEAFGAGETRDCVAIFNPIDPEADTFVIRVRGLVNDLDIENLGGDKWRVTERVLELTFRRPGDEFYTSLDKFKFVGQKWKSDTKEIELKPDGR